MVATDHFPTANEKDLHADIFRQARHPDDILVAASRDDILLFLHLFHRHQLIAKSCRLFKAEIICRFCHLCLQTAHDLVASPFKEKADIVYHSAVCFHRDISRAWCQTPLDMILKTRARRIHTLARADGEQFFEEAKRFVHGTRTRIRAEVPPAVFHHAPCDMDARICFRHRHLDVRIRLIIFQADIVSRSMPFDQIAL